MTAFGGGGPAYSRKTDKDAASPFASQATAIDELRALVNDLHQEQSTKLWELQAMHSQEVEQLRKDLLLLPVAQITKPKAPTPDVDSDEETPWYAADPGALGNLYTFALEKGLGSGRTPQGVTEGVVQLNILFFLQTMFAFGLLDSAKMINVMSGQPAYTALVDVSFFYADISVGGVPTINLVTSLCSFFLLSLFARQDAQGSLLSVCPLELLFFDSAARTSHEAKVGEPPSTVAWAVRCLYMQMFWTVRAAVVPTYCLLGSAFLLANADNAVDIVLNSVAASFILELDDALYQLLPAKVRESHEKKQTTSPRESSPLVVSGGQLLCWLCLTIVCFLDFTSMFLVYLEATQIIALDGEDGIHEDTFEAVRRVQIMMRASIFALFMMHVTSRARRESVGASTESQVWFYLRLLSFGASVVGVTAIVFSVVNAFFSMLFGFRGPVIYDHFDEVFDFEEGASMLGCLARLPSWVINGSSALYFSIDAERFCKGAHTTYMFGLFGEFLQQNAQSFGELMLAPWTGRGPVYPVMGADAGT